MNPPVALTDSLNLAQLQPYRWAQILHVEAPEHEALRLMGLGICAGRRLQLIKTGDPMILQVFGTRIGLAASLARRVHVALA